MKVGGGYPEQIVGSAIVDNRVDPFPKANGCGHIELTRSEHSLQPSFNHNRATIMEIHDHAVF